MYNVLILGSTGMLGQALIEAGKDYDIRLFTGCRDGSCNFFVDALNTEDSLSRLSDFIEQNEIDVIINAIGMLVEDSRLSLKHAIQVNGFFPLELGKLCRAFGVELIHVSTDCVYSGSSGPITREQIPDPKDEYGVSKYIGEFVSDIAMVLRTSIIGLDNSKNPQGLLNWVLSQENGKIKGYINAYWSGLTTKYLANFIYKNIILSRNYKTGLHNVATSCISKFELIKKIVYHGGLDIDVEGIKLDNEIDKCLISDFKDISDIDSQIRQIFE